MTGDVHAAYITGVTVTTILLDYVGDSVNNIINGSGLSSLSFTATHAAFTNTNAWAGNNTSGNVIDFNLHGSYNLSGLAVWNFNLLDIAGVKDLNILTSTDGTNYSPLLGAPLQFAIGANGTSEAAEQFAFTPVTAAYVRFNLISNWGYGGGVFGLDEVAFGGTPASASAPEPSVLALLGIGAAALVARRRRAI